MRPLLWLASEMLALVREMTGEFAVLETARGIVSECMGR